MTPPTQLKPLLASVSRSEGNVVVVDILTSGLNYTYIVWVYFLFYLGAGYPSWYYPYIIQTLLNYIPSECGGTGEILNHVLTMSETQFYQ